VGMSAFSFPIPLQLKRVNPFNHKHNATDQRPVPTSENTTSRQSGE
jgi:hypothetical protein